MISGRKAQAEGILWVNILSKTSGDGTEGVRREAEVGKEGREAGAVRLYRVYNTIERRLDFILSGKPLERE